MKFIALISLVSSVGSWAAGTISFSRPAESVETYDYVEVVANVEKPDARNPFLDASLTGSFAKADGSDRRTVEGF